jgi:hypothetical protein
MRAIDIPACATHGGRIAAVCSRFWRRLRLDFAAPDTHTSSSLHALRFPDAGHSWAGRQRRDSLEVLLPPPKGSEVPGEQRRTAAKFNIHLSQQETRTTSRLLDSVADSSEFLNFTVVRTRSALEARLTVQVMDIALTL